MLEKHEKTELPGAWTHSGTAKDHDKTTDQFRNQMTGSILELCHGWSPDYHHCYAHYIDMYGRMFSRSWGSNEEPGLTRGELGAFGVSIMRNRTNGGWPEDSHFSTSSMKDLEREANQLFEAGGEWSTADEPLEEVGIAQKNTPTYRGPNGEEWAMMRDFMVENWGYSKQEAVQNLQTSWAVVIDDYISDSPGYNGPVIFVVHGFPSAYEVLILDKDWNTGEVNGIKQVTPEWCSCL